MHYCLPMGAAMEVAQATMFDNTPTTVPATESHHGRPDQQARDSMETSATAASQLMPTVHRNSPTLHGTRRGTQAQVEALAAALAASAVGEAVLVAQLSAVTGAAERMQEARAAREREYCVQREAAWLAALEESARRMRCGMHGR